jgi:16S rRNA (guanine527-N7)-methyltransferase
VTDGAPAAALESRPPVAADVFGDRLEVAERYVDHLSTTGVDWGLLGPRELPRLWTRHVLNCAVLSELVPSSVRLIDIGSGAGLPGLPVALARPDLAVTLVEPLERRVAWLQMVVADLGLDIDVRRARAEDLRGELEAEVVTARAVAPLDRLARWALPLVSAHGELLALKGQSAAAEVAQHERSLVRLGATACDVVRCGEGLLETPTTVVRVRVGPSGGGRAGSGGAQPRGVTKASRKPSKGARGTRR